MRYNLYRKALFEMKVLKKAVWTGLEPVTSCVTGRHSNQLNYQTSYFVGYQNYHKTLKNNTLAYIFLIPLQQVPKEGNDLRAFTCI